MFDNTIVTKKIFKSNISQIKILGDAQVNKYYIPKYFVAGF